MTRTTERKSLYCQLKSSCHRRNKPRVVSSFSDYHPEAEPRHTYQTIGHAPLMFLGYVCHICKNHRKCHCKHSRDRDDSEVPPDNIRKRLERLCRNKSVLTVQVQFNSQTSHPAFSDKINLDKARREHVVLSAQSTKPNSTIFYHL